MWQMYCAYKEGISTREFRKSWMIDINNMIGIDNAINEKNMREQQLQRLKSQVR